jgi:hypothetical protein
VGKTLAVGIAGDNLCGDTPRTHVIFRQMDALLGVAFQCSAQSTATEIAGVYKRAEAQQAQFDRGMSRSAVTVRATFLLRACVYCVFRVFYLRALLKLVVKFSIPQQVHLLCVCVVPVCFTD